MDIQFHTRVLNLGCYMQYTENLSDTILDAIDEGMYAMAFDLGSSRNMKRKQILVEDLLLSMALSTRFPMAFFSFLPTMYNLCGSRRFLAWNGNVAQDKTTLAMLRQLEYEMYTLAKLGGSMVVEAGSYRTPWMGIEATAQSLNHMKYRIGYRMILINSVDEFSNIGITITTLQTIWDKCDKSNRKYMGIGLNVTAFHVNGIYDMSTSDGVSQMFTEYDKSFSAPPAVLVIDDTSTDFGSKELHRVAVCDGTIWKSNEDALAQLIVQSRRRNIPIITNHEESFVRLRSICENLIF